MRLFLSCRTWAAAIAAIYVLPIDTALAAPGFRGAAATQSPRVIHAVPSSRRLSRWSSSPQRRGHPYGFGGRGLRATSAAAPFYTGVFGQGSRAVPFYSGLFGGRSSGLGRGGRGYSGAGYNEGYYGGTAAFDGGGPVLQPPATLYPGLPGMPVVLGIEDTPVARPQIIVVNGDAGDEQSGLSRPRHARSPNLNGPTHPAYARRGVASAGPRIIHVSVPPG